MNNNSIKRTDPKQAVIGFLIFLFPFISLITPFGIGLSSFIFLVAALFFLKPGFAALRRHWPAIRWVVIFFAFNFFYTLACFALRGQELGDLEKPARMLFAVSAMMLVMATKPDRKALWWGVIGGAFVGMLLVGYQRLFLGEDRPGGLLNAITFGDIALSLGLIALASMIDVRAVRKVFWPAIGALAGLAASTMTGTRGGWLGLVLCGLLFIQHSHVLANRRVRAIVAFTFAFMAATYFVPETGVRERVRQGVVDITTYFSGGSALTNVGVRLELWKAAGILIGDAAVLGRGETGYRKVLEPLVQEGELDPVVLTMPHFHNEALQALVTGGVVGFAAWFGMILAPFAFFTRAISVKNASRQEFATALAGILLVTSYFGYGLTEVIFWSLKGALFYALMVFLLMGFYLNAKDAGQQPGPV
ncbi:O-antigen ligase family protein [Massilia sp. RP-1-19]|uniref:O-antigen ligase family protein n=1 Tax=Massilia polaris TaxID=2728846 RepID=A0A848HPM2_9BURK|nr:O-antigen ligase family protein [Massilia polaris]NML61193.1 O-antigen ligase family protein [Massilia polaris]